jgi:molybdopterin/thiamine biosynthesis adenylyltransferase
MDANEAFSREVAAGYEIAALGRAPVLWIGVGATGNNSLQTAILSGVSDIIVVDDDGIEPSNPARSPLFRRNRLMGAKRRWKAKEALLGAQELAFGNQPRLRYAIARSQQLGLGLIAQAGVVVGCVDNIEGRVWLADATRLLGIPFIELGLLGSNGHVSVFPNRSGDEPCWRCLHPDADSGGISCATIGRGLIDRGFAPATQSIAAVLGALGTEAVIQALHGNFPLANKTFHIDVRTGRSTLFEIPFAKDCPGTHRTIGNVTRVSVRSDDPLEKLFEELPSEWIDPVVMLPSPFVLSFPCRLCGKNLRIKKPDWAIRSAPQCDSCIGDGPNDPPIPVVVSQVRLGDELGRTPCRKLGIGPAAILIACDAATGSELALQLTGSVDEFLVELPKISHHADPANATEMKEVASCDAPETA